MKGPASRRAARPTVDNRADSLAVLREDLETVARADATQRLLKWEPLFEHWASKSNGEALCVLAGNRFHHLMTVGVANVLLGQPAGSPHLRDAIDLMITSADAQAALRSRAGQGGATLDPLLLNEMWLHGLAEYAGLPDVSNRLASLILEQLVGEGLEGTPSVESDVAFRQFYEALLKAQIGRQWPSAICHGSIPGYGRLLTSAGDEPAFRSALIEFCDFRISRSLGFDDMKATKRRSSSAERISVLEDGGWPTLWPLELFSLRLVYREVSGKELSLDADHPLLRSPLMKPGAVGSSGQDAFLRRFRTVQPA